MKEYVMEYFINLFSGFAFQFEDKSNMAVEGVKHLTMICSYVFCEEFSV